MLFQAAQNQKAGCPIRKRQDALGSTVQTTRLSNGLTVVTDTMPNLHSAALGVWVRTGSRAETAKQNGITHLLEHMAFKGTATRSARHIAEEIEAVGGELNASTSVEYTNYYARVLSEDVPLAIDLISDILRNSVFDPNELAREKQVILQEIGAALDSPEDCAFDLFQDTAWPEQALGRPILGTRERVLEFDSSAIHAYLRDRYRAPDMVLAAAGAIDHAEIVALAEEKFADFSSEPASHNTPALYKGGSSHVSRELMEAQVLVGFKGFDYCQEDYFTTQILASVLGGGMSSRLFQHIREELGLCYAIYAFHWAFSDTGVFGIHAATSEDQVRNLMPALIDELVRSTTEISAEEVDRAHAQIKAGLLMALESPAARAGQIARQMLVHGRTLDLEEITDRIDRISVADVRRVAGEIIHGDEPTLVAYGPVEGIMTLDEMKARLGSKASQTLPA